MLAMCINPLQLGRCDFCLSAFPTASHRSSLTRHFVVGISRMEVIAHTRTSSNDRRSHQCDTGISNEYVINFYCPFGPPPLILSLACDTILILSQEALFCYPHHFRLLYSPQHSWGIRLFIYILPPQFFLPMQNPRMARSLALLSIGTSPFSRNTRRYRSWFRA